MLLLPFHLPAVMLLLLGLQSIRSLATKRLVVLPLLPLKLVHG